MSYAISVLPCSPRSHLIHPSRVSHTVMAWINKTFADCFIHLYAWHPTPSSQCSAVHSAPTGPPAGCVVRVLSYRGPALCRDPPVQVRGLHPCRSTAAPPGTGPSTTHRSRRSERKPELQRRGASGSTRSAPTCCGPLSHPPLAQMGIGSRAASPPFLLMASQKVHLIILATPSGAEEGPQCLATPDSA